MKILVLCEKLDIDLTSSGVGRSKLLRCLGQTGFDIDCIFDQFVSTNLPDIQGITFHRLNKKNKSAFLSIFRRFGKLNALHHYIVGFNGDLMQSIMWWKTQINLHVNSAHYNLILLLGTGQQLTPYFAMHDIKTKVPIVLNFHDPYPEALHPEFKKPINFVFKRRMRMIQNLVARAYKITTPSQRLLDELKNYYPIGNKGVIIPHPGIPTPTTGSKTHIKQLVISHTGLLLGSRNPKTFLKVVHDFLQENPGYRQILRINHIGPVKYNDPELEQVKRALNDVLYFHSERITYEESLKIQTESDVLLLIDFDSEGSIIMLGKLADYFANLKPIFALTPDNSETSRLLGKTYELKAPGSDYNQIKCAFIKMIEAWQKEELGRFVNRDLAYYVCCDNIKSIFTREIINTLIR